MPDCATDSHVVCLTGKSALFRVIPLPYVFRVHASHTTPCRRSERIGAVQFNSPVFVAMPFAVFSVSISIGVWLRKQVAWGICCCLVQTACPFRIAYRI